MHRRVPPHTRHQPEVGRRIANWDLIMSLCQKDRLLSFDIMQPPLEYTLDLHIALFDVVGIRVGWTDVGQVAVMRPVLKVERKDRVGQIFRVRAAGPHVPHAVREEYPRRAVTDEVVESEIFHERVQSG